MTFEGGHSGSGWNAPTTEKYLEESLQNASKNFYGKQAMHLGEGGSIPLMNFFNKRFPNAQFIVTGVLGPLSNAHGPNEFLEIDYTKKLIMCMSQVIADMQPHLKQR